jgi:endonuclease-3 related protein
LKKNLLAIYKKLHREYGPRDWWPADTPFEVIVGAILTQNTAWSNVEKAIKNLKAERLLCPRSMADVKASKLARLIRPAGYFNVKAKRLKNFSDTLSGRYGNSLKRLFSLPTRKLREELLAINGIGPETADSILLYAAGRPVFVIDAYTKRIFSRHGIVGQDAAYGRMQRLFMEGLPRSARLFNEYHALIVELAKRHCRKSPLCEGCPLKAY